MLSPHILTVNEILTFTALFVSSAIIALGSTYCLIVQFRKWHILANSDARSMHDLPIPIGGGWAILPLALVAWVASSWPIEDSLIWVVLASTLLLALLSWVDDRQQVSQLIRITLQMAAIAAVLLLLPDNRTVFSPHWPLWADRVITGLCWLWFVNLFNFMDGIDGLVGIEILFICAGFVFIGLEIGTQMPTLHMLTVLAGATVGFLWWNWHPAKIFLGDVGSISLSFLLGWFLIELAMSGYLIAAFLLPAYFIADATATIIKRILKGEAFWEPHRTHYYQRATLGLANNHSQALWKIIPANFGLLALAITSIWQPLISAFCGILVVIFLLVVLERYAVK